MGWVQVPLQCLDCGGVPLPPTRRPVADTLLGFTAQRRFLGAARAALTPSPLGVAPGGSSRRPRLAKTAFAVAKTIYV